MRPLLDARSLLAECLKAGALWIASFPGAPSALAGLDELATEHGLIVEVAPMGPEGWVVVAR